MNTANPNPDSDEVRIVRTTSTFDCGGRCPLRLHIKGNRIKGRLFTWRRLRNEYGLHMRKTDK